MEQGRGRGAGARGVPTVAHRHAANVRCHEFLHDGRHQETHGVRSSGMRRETGIRKILYGKAVQRSKDSQEKADFPSLHQYIVHRGK